MTEAAAHPRRSTSDPAPAGKIVLRQTYWIAFGLALAAGLAVTHFLATSSGSLWSGTTGGAAIGALAGTVKQTVYRYVFESGLITVRDLYRGRRSVDLTRLTSAAVSPWPSKLLPGLDLGGRYLVLWDDQGATVRLNFSGTRPGPRRQLLAAIEPYVMADGVGRVGLVREALDGKLWRPRPR